MTWILVVWLLALTALVLMSLLGLGALGAHMRDLEGVRRDKLVSDADDDFDW